MVRPLMLLLAIMLASGLPIPAAAAAVEEGVTTLHLTDAPFTPIGVAVGTRYPASHTTVFDVRVTDLAPHSTYAWQVVFTGGCSQAGQVAYDSGPFKALRTNALGAAGSVASFQTVGPPGGCLHTLLVFAAGTAPAAGQILARGQFLARLALDFLTTWFIAGSAPGTPIHGTVRLTHFPRTATTLAQVQVSGLAPHSVHAWRLHEVIFSPCCAMGPLTFDPGPWKELRANADGQANAIVLVPTARLGGMVVIHAGGSAAPGAIIAQSAVSTDGPAPW